MIVTHGVMVEYNGLLCLWIYGLWSMPLSWRLWSMNYKFYYSNKSIETSSGPLNALDRDRYEFTSDDRCWSVSLVDSLHSISSNL